MTKAWTLDPEDAFGWIDLNGRTSVVVALSGGSDSTALLLAFKRWADRAQPQLRLVAVTVDHGLRAGSANEAKLVEAFCRRAGIDHLTRRWSGQKPGSGVADAARKARYKLLADAAREAGTDIVLTGHTADDQAETVFMRSARSEGRGLAGMARATLFDGSVWIIRPFLAEDRDALRRSLKYENVTWIDDPSNIDPAYERVRARQALGDGKDRYALIETARKKAVERMKANAAAAGLIGNAAKLAAPGLVKLDAAFLIADDAGLEAWRVLLACCGGRAHLASRDDVSKHLERLAAGRTCLSGTVAVQKRDAAYLYRERRRGHRLRVDDGIFDGRYRLDRHAVEAGWRLRAMTIEEQASGEQALAVADGPAPRELMRNALAGEPVLDSGMVKSARYFRENPQIRRILAPFDHFLPEFDLILANATAKLLGRACFPLPPVRGQAKPSLT